jgi:hypothetical protein
MNAGVRERTDSRHDGCGGSTRSRTHGPVVFSPANLPIGLVWLDGRHGARAGPNQQRIQLGPLGPTGTGKAVLLEAGQSERDERQSGYDGCEGYDTCFGLKKPTKGGLPVPVEQALSLNTHGEIRGGPTDWGKPLSRESGRMTEEGMMDDDSDMNGKRIALSLCEHLRARDVAMALRPSEASLNSFSRIVRTQSSDTVSKSTLRRKRRPQETLRGRLSHQVMHSNADTTSVSSRLPRRCRSCPGHGPGQSPCG